MAKEYESMMCRIHCHELLKMPFKDLRIKKSNYSTFGCDAKSFKECKSGMKEND